MEELINIVTGAARAFFESDKFKSLIEKQMEGCLKSIVTESLSSYSDFGKAITEHVKSSLQIDLRELGISGYNQTVLAIIKTKLDAAIEIQGRAKLEKDLQKLLDGHAPASIKLSELVKQFKTWVKKDCRDKADRVTIIYEKSEYGSKWVYLDPQPRKEKYQCRFRMLISDYDNRASMSISGIDPSKAVFAGNVYGFDKTLFYLYAAGTKIEVDQTEFDCYLTPSGDEDEESVEETEDELV